MSVDKDTVRRIAHLARVAISDDDATALTNDFNNILDFVEQLNELDISDVEPMTSAVDASMKMRVDEVTDGGKAEAVLANAPVRRDGFYGVPKVVE